MDFYQKNVVVYDLEIKNVIDGKNVTWGDHHKMGISVGCCFDFREYTFKIFMDDNMPLLVERLNQEGTLIVAFNNINFDNKLLRKDPLLVEKGIVLKPDSELKQYDMLLESRKAFNVGMYEKGFKLDDHLKHMNLPLKTDDGANAPILYQQGKIGELTNYCLQDVIREKMMFDRICLDRFIANAYAPGGMEIEPPVHP